MCMLRRLFVSIIVNLIDPLLLKLNDGSPRTNLLTRLMKRLWTSDVIPPRIIGAGCNQNIDSLGPPYAWRTALYDTRRVHMLRTEGRSLFR